MNSSWYAKKNNSEIFLYYDSIEGVTDRLLSDYNDSISVFKISESEREMTSVKIREFLDKQDNKAP